MIFLALRNLAARPRRTLLTALAVIVGVAMTSGAFVLTDSMNRTVDGIFGGGEDAIDVVVSPRIADTASNGGTGALPTIDSALLDRVRGVDGVRDAVGETFAVVQMLKARSDDPITVGPPAFIASVQPKKFSSFSLVEGRDPGGRGEVSIEETTAERGGYELGDDLRIVTPAGLERPRIVGVVKYSSDSLAGAAVALAAPAEAQRLSGNAGTYDGISVEGDDGVPRKVLSDRIAAALRGEPVTVRTREAQAEAQAGELKDALGFLQPVLLAFAAIALFVGSFVIVNSFAATLAQRSQELAMLRTLGATRRQLQRSVQLEAAITGLIAGIVGMAAGVLVAKGILAMFKGFGIDLPAQGTVIEPRTIVVSVVLGVVVTMIAAWRPVSRATAVPPIQAMRGLDTAQEQADRRPGPGAYAVAILAVGGMVGSVLASGTLAALLVGGAAILTFLAVAMFAPVVLVPLMRVLGLLAAWRGEPGRLARLNAVRNPRRTATTAGALMVGVALVTFVAVFAAGIGALVRYTFGERVKAPLALSSSGVMGFPAAAQKVVAADPDVRAVVGLSYANFALRGADSVQLSGFDEGLAQVYKLDWVDGSDAVLGQLGADGVVIDTESDNPVLKRAEVGDRLTLLDAAEQPVAVTVRGRVKEGNTLLGGGLLGPRGLIDGQNAARAQLSLALLALRPGADRDAVQKRLKSSLKADFPTVKPLTGTELENQFVGQINQLVNMIYAFLFFALLVSLLGISTTFGLVVQERRRELGILRAVGMTRRQIRSLIRWEAILTGLIGAVLGIVIGLGFGALSTKLLGEDGIGFVVPVGTLVVVVIAAALVAALAAGRPARRAGKVDVVQVLTTE